MNPQRDSHWKKTIPSLVCSVKTASSILGESDCSEFNRKQTTERWDAIQYGQQTISRSPHLVEWWRWKTERWSLYRDSLSATNDHVNPRGVIPNFVNCISSTEPIIDGEESVTIKRGTNNEIWRWPHDITDTKVRDIMSGHSELTRCHIIFHFLGDKLYGQRACSAQQTYHQSRNRLHKYCWQWQPNRNTNKITRCTILMSSAWWPWNWRRKFEWGEVVVKINFVTVS